jgi:hypothetical protein
MKRRGSRRSLIPRVHRTSSLPTGVRARLTPVWLAVGGLCVIMAVATPADAAPAAHRSPAGDVLSSAPAPNLVAGYLAAPEGGLETASLSFKVPRVDCTEGEARAITIGLGDVQDLEAPQLRAHVMLTCGGGSRAEYTFAAQACSHEAGPLATRHGHKVTVGLTQSDGMITMSVTDEDDGVMISATDSVTNCDPQQTTGSVLFGAFPVFAPTLMDVPEFNRIKSRHAMLNDADLSGERVDRQTDPGIKTGKLRGDEIANGQVEAKRTGDKFVLKFRDVVHCCLKSPSPSGAPQRAV